MDQIMIHNYGETLCFGSHEGATKWYNAEGSFLLLLDENEDPAAVRGSLQVVLEAKVHPKLLVVALAHPKWVEIGSFHVFTDWSKLIASRKEI